MTPPKCIKPGQVGLVTVGCIGRLYRLVPTRKTVKLTWKCLAAAAQRFSGKIRLHGFKFMSNHLHILLTDSGRVLPDFMRWFDSLLARSLNASRGLSGKNFEGYELQVIEADDAKRILEAAVYILLNPCAAHLVTRSRHWEGVSSVHMRFGESRTFAKPALGLWAGKLRHLRGRKSARSGRDKYARSVVPETSTLTLHRLPGFDHLSTDELDALLMAELDKGERMLIAMRRHHGIRVVGWRKVVAEHHNTVAATLRELFDRNPTFAASTDERRERLARQQREFRRAYYSALRRYRAGDHSVEFPYGTWKMVRIYNASMAAPPIPS